MSAYCEGNALGVDFSCRHDQWRWLTKYTERFWPAPKCGWDAGMVTAEEATGMADYLEEANIIGEHHRFLADLQRNTKAVEPYSYVTIVFCPELVVKWTGFLRKSAGFRLSI